jgi:hypothetical protein
LTKRCKISTPAGCWKDRPIDRLLRLTWYGKTNGYLENVHDLHRGSMRSLLVLPGRLSTLRREAPMLACHLSSTIRFVGKFEYTCIPPRVGCSILITSALHRSQLMSATCRPRPEAYRAVPKISQNLCAIWLVDVSNIDARTKLFHILQPALWSCPAP